MTRTSRHGPWGRRSALMIAAALVLALALTGCRTGPPAPLTAGALQAAQDFPYFTVYWVGPRFEDLPITAADALETYSPKIGDSVIYGDCGPGKGALHTGGCTLPLQITTVVFLQHSNRGLGPQRNAIIRGVPATLFNKDKSIELYSGRVAIDVYADTPARALAAAKALRPLNPPGAPRGPLPPPAYCPGLWGVAPHFRVARGPDGRLDCISLETSLGAGTPDLNAVGTPGTPQPPGP